MLLFFFVLVNFRTLKWVLPTRLRRFLPVLPTTLARLPTASVRQNERHYGLRPSGKTKGSLPQLRAFPHSKAQPAGFRATTQLMHLALSDPSLRRKRHESVMSLVMKR